MYLQTTLATSDFSHRYLMPLNIGHPKMLVSFPLHLIIPLKKKSFSFTSFGLSYLKWLKIDIKEYINFYTILKGKVAPTTIFDAYLPTAATSPTPNPIFRHTTFALLLDIFFMQVSYPSPLLIPSQQWLQTGCPSTNTFPSVGPPPPKQMLP